MLSHQGVELFKRLRRIVLVRVGGALLEERCRWGHGPRGLSLWLLCNVTRVCSERESHGWSRASLSRQDAEMGKRGSTSSDLTLSPIMFLLLKILQSPKSTACSLEEIFSI